MPFFVLISSYIFSGKVSPKSQSTPPSLVEKHGLYLKTSPHPGLVVVVGFFPFQLAHVGVPVFKVDM